MFYFLFFWFDILLLFISVDPETTGSDHRHLYMVTCAFVFTGFVVFIASILLNRYFKKKWAVQKRCLKSRQYQVIPHDLIMETVEWNNEEFMALVQNTAKLKSQV